MGQAANQRQLATFEVGANPTTGAAVLALGAAACGLALAGGGAAANALAILLRPGSGL
jgi:hypothetical protein